MLLSPAAKCSASGEQVAKRNSGGGWTKTASSLGAPNAVIPIGGMYRSTVDVDPATVLGYGTWVKRTPGTMITVFAAGATPEEVAYTWERTA